MQEIRVMQELVEADPQVLPHRTILSVGMGLPLHILEVALEDAEEARKGVGLDWALCWQWNILS